MACACVSIAVCSQHLIEVEVMSIIHFNVGSLSYAALLCRSRGRSLSIAFCSFNVTTAALEVSVLEAFAGVHVIELLDVVELQCVAMNCLDDSRIYRHTRFAD